MPEKKDNWQRQLIETKFSQRTIAIHKNKLPNCCYILPLSHFWLLILHAHPLGDFSFYIAAAYSAAALMRFPSRNYALGSLGIDMRG